MRVADYEVREGEGSDGAPVYDVYAKYEDDFFADCLDTYFTEEGAYRHVAQLLLDDFEEGSNWYEGIGVDTFPKLQVKNKVPGKDVESLDWEATLRNTRDFMKVLRYAALELVNPAVVNAMLWETMPFVADSDEIDPLVKTVEKMRKLSIVEDGEWAVVSKYSSKGVTRLYLMEYTKDGDKVTETAWAAVKSMAINFGSWAEAETMARMITDDPSVYADIVPAEKREETDECEQR